MGKLDAGGRTKAHGGLLALLVVLACLAVSSCESDAPSGSSADSPTAGPTSPGASAPTTDSTAKATGSADVAPTPDVDEWIAGYYRRPSAGATGPRRTLLLAYTGARRGGGGQKAAAYRLYDRGGEVIGQGLLEGRTLPDSVLVFPVPQGFVMLSGGERASRLTADGVLTDLRTDTRRTRPARGDVLLEGFEPSVFRPSSLTIHTRLIGPPGASITHVDGHGVWWALGRPENGQAVVFSAVPGEAWAKHVVGEFSDTRNGCACDTDPGPLGRGAVVVVAGNPLQHGSLDYGRTWTTWDLGDTVPYQRVLAHEDYPAVSALADGRIVIGYSTLGFWIADDATNGSFVQEERIPQRELWLAGLDLPLVDYMDNLVFRPGQVSADGGGTWVDYP